MSWKFSHPRPEGALSRWRTPSPDVATQARSRHRRPEGRARRLGAAFAALAIGASVVSGAGVALADGDGPGQMGGSGTNDFASIHHGAFISSWAGSGGNIYTFCVDGGRPRPSNNDNYSKSTLNAPQLAAVLNQFDTGNADEGSGDDVAYEALYEFALKSPEVEHNYAPDWKLPKAATANVQQLADNLQTLDTFAARYAGPYNVKISKTQDGANGTVTVGVKSAQDQYVGAVKGSISITGGSLIYQGQNIGPGPLMIETPGDGRSPSDALNIPVVLDGTGPATVTVTFKGLNDGTVIKWTPPGGVNKQGVISKGGTTEVSGSISFDAAPPPPPTSFQPQVTTKTSAATAAIGTQLTDTLVVTTANNAPWIGGPLTVTSTLYGPFTSAPVLSATVPAGAPIAGTVTTQVDKAGTYTTPSVTLTAAGYYVWHETIPAGTNSGAWTGQYGVTDETTQVPTPVTPTSFQPQVTTKTSAATAAIGTQLTDTLVVTTANNAPWIGGPLTVTSTLYGPFTSAPVLSATVPAGAPIAGTVTTQVDKAGTYTTPSVTLTAAGYYVWHETIPAGTNSGAWTGQYGVTDETTQVPTPVTPTSFQPQVTTKTSAATAAIGTQLTDTLVVTTANNAPWIGGPLTVTSTLYGPFTSAPVLSATVPAGAPIAGTVTTQVDKAGTYTTPSVTLTAAGYYVWHETIPAGTNSGAWTGQYGVTDETTQVPTPVTPTSFQPQVTTKTSAATAAIGTQLTDTLVVTTANNAPWIGGPLTVTSTLYGPFTSAPVLSATVPAGAPIAGTVTTQVDKAGTYTTPSVTLTAAGYYVWHETIPAGTNSGAWTGQYGVTDETTQVPTPVTPTSFQPQVTTKTSAATAAIGTQLTDTLVVTTANNAPWIGGPLTVTSTLYGPFTSAPVLSATVPAGAPIAGTVTTQVDKAGTYTTPSVTLTAAGYYVWHETIPAGTNSGAWTGQYGVTDETTQVPTPVTPTSFQPQVTTKTSAATAAIGTQLTDTLVVTTANNAPWIGGPLTVTSTLYGPFTSAPVLSATVPAGAPIAGKVTTQVDKAGTYTTPSVTLTAAGYYVWHETIPAGTNSGAWTGQYGVTDETTQVPTPVTPPTKATPMVTTLTSAQIATPGTVLTDTLTVTGVNPAHPVVITTTLYGPFAELPATSTGPAADALQAGTVSITVNGSGKFVTPGVTVNAPGFYVWYEKIPGDDFNNAWQPPTFPLTYETTVVKWAPSVTTKTSVAIATKGTLLSDTLVVTGVNPNHPVTITSTLYGPYTTLPVTSNGPGANDPKVGVAQTTVTGPGTYVTAALPLPSTGFYVWYETIPGDTYNTPWTPPTFPQAPETTVVKWIPSVTTVTSAAIASAGTALTDTLTVTGVHPTQPVTISTTLYGPFAELPATSTGPAADAPKVGTVSVTVTGPGTYVTPALTLPSAGYYVWYETIPGDNFHTPWTPPTFPQTYETTVVKSTPSVTTVTSVAVASIGTQLTDTLLVAGVNPNHQVTITSTLYGPYTVLPATSGGPGANDPQVGTVTTSVTGPGTFVTPALTLPATGFYVWYETIPGDQYNTPWKPPTFPQVPETTVVKWSPAVSTVTSVANAAIGTKLTDTLNVTGVHPTQSVIVSSTLYGPYAALPATSSGPGVNDPKVGTVTTTVTGSGKYVTPALTLTAAGYYVWYETIPGDAFHNPWKPTSYPQPSETTLVQVTTVRGAGGVVGGRAGAATVIIPNNLAFTGVSQSTPFVLGFGLVLLAVGGAFLVIGRKRKKA
ncbi:hypothetical protein EH165_02110 [Nakamurella antarctica]|uniref:LPXTG-motif cell wall anchor domain-containing protein n=1 Tax=Nakamurella antarctica TaxID=1902245 RepID=A0A3G8ZID9_9ACTN|nr:hypothetical protein [Nakamurella antarctica]AZI57139.1 hypothetical protein EH165_02110 [Nakamurella antarctica]